MALRLSTGLRNYLMAEGSFKHAFNGGKMLIYSGSQPTTADDAASGTLLVTISNNSGTLTDEVRAQGKVTPTGTTGGISTLTIDSVDIIPAAVPFNGTLAQTAADLAAAINNYCTSPNYVASVSGSDVTISAAQQAGTEANGLVIAATYSGDMGLTIVQMGTTTVGVASANGLRYGISTSGALVKYGTWSGVAGAGGTAGWFRLCGPCGSVAQHGNSSSTLIRMDGNISTSGANLNMSSTIITASTTTTIDTFTVTEPAA